MMIHKILVALDRSESSSQVFEQAVSLAQATHSSLMLMTVFAPFEQAYPNVGYPGMNGLFLDADEGTMHLYLEQWQALEQENINWLRSQTAEATKAGIKAEFTHSLGDAGRNICTLAQTWEADLIIIGRRGLSRISELFLGSVSNYVLHHAPCSVLTVQMPLRPEIPHQQSTADKTTPERML